MPRLYEVVISNVLLIDTLVHSSPILNLIWCVRICISKSQVLVIVAPKHPTSTITESLEHRRAFSGYTVKFDCLSCSKTTVCEFP